MVKRKWLIILSLAFLVIVLQFFQPGKNQGVLENQADLFQNAEYSDSLKTILLTSCYDCHSNYTHYPWYGRISPVSFFLDNHIARGKKKLNFSNWAGYSKNKQISLLTKICDEVSEGSMPLKSYLVIHKNALIEETQKIIICNWTNDTGLSILTGN